MSNLEGAPFAVLLMIDLAYLMTNLPQKIRIPSLGWVKMRESLRFDSKILSAKLFSRGGRWFVSIAVEMTDTVKLTRQTGKSVGIDLGMTDLVTLFE